MQRAEGDAARFRSILVEYQKAPGVTRDRLYLDMMQSVLGNSSKIIVDQKGSGNLLYLPLDKLMQQTATPPASDAPQIPRSSQPVVPEPAAPAEPPRNRDGLRSRER